MLRAARGPDGAVVPGSASTYAENVGIRLRSDIVAAVPDDVPLPTTTTESTPKLSVALPFLGRIMLC